ncbi:GSCOCG00000774001-RA-CDS [Cotesia congregata]|nr:GSCOCG00000774001-RA-CDS [Cotesia congregata]
MHRLVMILISPPAQLTEVGRVLQCKQLRDLFTYQSFQDSL